MKRSLALLLILVLLLTGCGRKNENAVTAGNASSAEDAIPEAVAPQTIPYTVSDRVTQRSYDGLTISVTAPEFTAELPGVAETLNSYYTLLAGKVLDYAEGDLQPDPARGIAYTVTAGYQISLMTQDILSVLWQVGTQSTGENPDSITFSAATFHMDTGALMTFEELFAKDPTGARQAFIHETRSCIESMGSSHTFDENWHELADTALHNENFYLTEESVYMIYNQAEFGEHASIYLTWEELAPFLPE